MGRDRETRDMDQTRPRGRRSGPEAASIVSGSRALSSRDFGAAAIGSRRRCSGVRSRSRLRVAIWSSWRAQDRERLLLSACRYWRGWSATGRGPLPAPASSHPRASSRCKPTLRSSRSLGSPISWLPRSSVGNHSGRSLRHSRSARMRSSRRPAACCTCWRRLETSSA